MTGATGRGLLLTVLLSLLAWTAALLDMRVLPQLAGGFAGVVLGMTILQGWLVRRQRG